MPGLPVSDGCPFISRESGRGALRGEGHADQGLCEGPGQLPWELRWAPPTAPLLPSGSPSSKQGFRQTSGYWRL